MQGLWGFYHIALVLIGMALIPGMTSCTAPSLPPLPTPIENSSPANVVQAQPRVPTAGYSLGAGDVLRINVYDHPDLSQEVTLEADGSFQYPLIGRVEAAGLIGPQVEELLTKRLATGYLVSPQVSVTITKHKSQQVYVMGAVKSPGPLPLERKSTLLEMLSAAGGPTTDAGLEILLVRNTDNQTTPTENRTVSSVPPGQPLIRMSL